MEKAYNLECGGRVSLTVDCGLIFYVMEYSCGIDLVRLKAAVGIKSRPDARKGVLKAGIDCLHMGASTSDSHGLLSSNIRQG